MTEIRITVGGKEVVFDMTDELKVRMFADFPAFAVMMLEPAFNQIFRDDLEEFHRRAIAP